MLNKRFFLCARAVLMVLGAFSFLSSCAGKTPIPEPEIDSYKPAMRELGERLADRLGELDGGLGKPNTYFIYNADLKGGEESELARRFIHDLEIHLSSKGIRIKRKEMVTRVGVAGGSAEVDCPGLEEPLASDYLIGFNIRERSGPDGGFVATVQVVPNKSNVIEFAARAPIGHSSIVDGWYARTLYLPRMKGTTRNPFVEWENAADSLIGRLGCIARNLGLGVNGEPIDVIIGKTEGTNNSTFLDAVGGAATTHGFMYVPTDKWLTVLLKEGDRLEQDIYLKKHRKKFPAANLLLALDVCERGEGQVRLEARLISLDTVKIVLDGAPARIPPNIMMPFCVTNGFFEDVLYVEGEGRDSEGKTAFRNARESNKERFIDAHVIPMLDSKTPLPLEKIRSIVNAKRSEWIPSPMAHTIQDAGKGVQGRARVLSRVNRKRFDAWLCEKLVHMRTADIDGDPVWWRPYVKANYFSALGCWKNVETELTPVVADLDIKNMDQRTAAAILRKNNPDVFDFSPRRELAISLYKQGNIEKAKRVLDDALLEKESNDPETLKYLELVRKAWIDKGSRDRRPPEIFIQPVWEGAPVNKVYVNVEGVATDDTFVHRIKIGKNEYPIPVPKKKIPFFMKIPIHPGENAIPILVTDLAGKTTAKKILVHIDRTGPVVYIEALEKEDSNHGNRIFLKGCALDESGVIELSVNQQRIYCNDADRKVPFEKSFTIDPSEPYLRLAAKDGAGNVTMGKIALSGEIFQGGARMASLESGDGLNPGSCIKSDLDDEMATYEDRIRVGWSIRAGRGVEKIIIRAENGKVPINVKENRSGILFLSHMAGLKEGDNNIGVTWWDRSGAPGGHLTRIKREMLKDLELGARARIVLEPVAWGRRLGSRLPENLDYLIYSELDEALESDSRFSTLEREKLDRLLEERALVQNGVFKAGAAPVSGRMLGADYKLFCVITEMDSYFMLRADLVDIETSRRLAVVSIEKDFDEIIRRPAYKEMCRDLVAGLNEKLPMVEGEVVKKDGREIYLDIGGETGIKPGMKLSVFKIIGVVKDPREEDILGRDIRTIARARVENVGKDKVSAILNEDVDMDPGSGKYYAITR